MFSRKHRGKKLEVHQDLNNFFWSHPSRLGAWNKISIMSSNELTLGTLVVSESVSSLHRVSSTKSISKS